MSAEYVFREELVEWVADVCEEHGQRQQAVGKEPLVFQLQLKKNRLGVQANLQNSKKTLRTAITKKPMSFPQDWRKKPQMNALNEEVKKEKERQRQAGRLHSRHADT